MVQGQHAEEIRFAEFKFALRRQVILPPQPLFKSPEGVVVRLGATCGSNLRCDKGLRMNHNPANGVVKSGCNRLFTTREASRKTQSLNGGDIAVNGARPKAHVLTPNSLLRQFGMVRWQRHGRCRLLFLPPNIELPMSRTFFRGLFTCLVATLTLVANFAFAADPAEVFEAKEFKSKEDGPALKYRILSPVEYDANVKYPVVLFLHGAGERGDDNAKQLVHGMKDFASDDMRKKHPAFVIAPQCPTNQWWTARNSDAEKSTDDSLALCVGVIEELKKTKSIDADRIYITGLSMGGYGSWEALARMPDYFAAAIPICGGGNPKNAEKFKHVPLWVFHGDKDDAVKVERSREMIEALKSAGAEPKYTEYPGVGHNSWTETYKNPEVHAWLFEQKRKAK